MNTSTFFLQHLIPAAQAFELMNDSLGSLWNESDRLRLGRMKESLNIVACKAMVCEEKQLDELAAVLQSFVVTLRMGKSYKCHILNVLKVRGATLTPNGEKNAALPGPRNQLASARWAARAEVLEKFDSLKEHAKTLETICGYAPEKRNEFLDLHRATTLGGKPSAWSTLVRNARWTTALEKLGLLVELVEAPDLEKHFGSFEGNRRLPSLWQDWFGVAYDASFGSARPEDMLPAYVTVRSTPAGTLLVSATSPGKEAYNPAELSTITSVTLARAAGQKVPATLDAINLDRLSLVREVPWAKLGEALNEVETWRADIKAKTVAKLEAANRFLGQQKLSQLRQSLERSLDPKTLKLLQDALSKGENPLSDAAVAPAGATSVGKAAKKTGTATKSANRTRAPAKRKA